jgi:glycosyltransferase involved in cell wall biosynthesis
MSLAAGVIVKSQPMAQTLMALGARPDRLLISPSGANRALFKGSAPAIAPPVFLAVGRFVEKKGPLHTIRAFSLLETETQPREQRPQLWMVGEGPLVEEAKVLVQSLELQDRVHLLGLRRQEEVASLMREVRGFVQHSLVAPDGDSEGSPVAVMEAQLSGLPVVATRHAGIPEVVLEGESGFLVDEGDVAAMAVAIAKLIKDPALAARLGDCGRRRVLEGFTIDHHLRQVSGLVLKVIEESSS